MRRMKSRGIVIVGCCLVALLGLPGQATAAPILDRSADTETLARVGELLRQRLGDSFAEVWLDEASGQLVVGVTDARQAALARVLGATPRVVARNSAALAAAMARLDARSANVPASVTGWYVDVTTNSVVVSVLANDPAAAAFAAAGGDGVRIEQVAEAPVLYWSIIGGQAITIGGVRCSAGFNVRSAAARYVITAGHCTNFGTNWNGVGGTLGTRAGTSFPGNDYGIIKVTSTAAASTALVDRYSSGSDVTVAGSASAIVGARVCRSGSTSGWRCGAVKSKNVTVNYGNGKLVSGLTGTSACAEPGDSGGAFVTQPLLTTRVQAQGLTSGGSGDCITGGTTFFQPVGEVLAVYGVTLVTG